MLKVIVDENGTKEECSFLTLNENGSITVELRKAYDFKGEKNKKELTMREPTMVDNLNHSQDGSLDSEIPFLADLVLLTPEDIKKLSERDYKRLQKARAGFLED